MSLRFANADVDEARTEYSGSSLTRGVARATIGSRQFSSEGECLVHAETYSFSATSGDLIGLGIDADRPRS